MKIVLTLIKECMNNYLLPERGEEITHNDDHLTLKLADGKTYRLTVEEISE